ncbi:cytochrome C [Chitinophaga parva]|uniref:Cytochrome C n=1 Tax=Chitinophaga parva TaxID=2169414 RepID=A0A2T7BN32_9BACT|nr:c-type cytochrome [Chitinophaga parva]PUZ29031.1 cytochrome C [Chitinophaga parva]
MKKGMLASVVMIAVFMAACGGGSKNDKATEGAKSETPAAADNSMVAPGAGAPASKGETLEASLDCKTCHKVDMKVVGPSFKEIANKYPATDENIDMLASKIISGGSGHWGTTPMTPHPDLAKDDAKEIVKYILAQK